MASTVKTSVVPFALTATGTGTAQHLVAGGDAGHKFSTGAYPAFGGKDEAPSPLFCALGSLTSCNQVTGTLVAKDLGVRLGAWSFEVQGDLDTSVLVAGAEGHANFDKVTVGQRVDQGPATLGRLTGFATSGRLPPRWRAGWASARWSGRLSRLPR